MFGFLFDNCYQKLHMFIKNYVCFTEPIVNILIINFTQANLFGHISRQYHFAIICSEKSMLIGAKIIYYIQRLYSVLPSSKSTR